MKELLYIRNTANSVLQMKDFKKIHYKCIKLDLIMFNSYLLKTNPNVNYFP